MCIYSYFIHLSLNFYLHIWFLDWLFISIRRILLLLCVENKKLIFIGFFSLLLLLVVCCFMCPFICFCLSVNFYIIQRRKYYKTKSQKTKETASISMIWPIIWNVKTQPFFFSNFYVQYNYRLFFPVQTEDYTHTQGKTKVWHQTKIDHFHFRSH